MNDPSHQASPTPASGRPRMPDSLPRPHQPGRLSAIFHDAIHPRGSNGEASWYVQRLPRDSGTILDAMSGTGRILPALLDAGLAVHGVDVSEAMVSTCAAHLAAAGRETELFRQDITALNLPFRYAAAFISEGSFQSLTGRHAAMDALLRLRAHLVDPGVLLLDLFIPQHAEHPPGAAVIEVRHAVLDDGTLLACRSERTFDTLKRRVRTQTRYEQRAKSRIVAREDETTSMTWYDEAQIAALLADAGYRSVSIEPPATTSADARHFAVKARIPD